MKRLSRLHFDHPIFFLINLLTSFSINLYIQIPNPKTNNNNSFTCSNNNDGNLSISFNKMEDISKSDFSFNDISVIKEEDHESSPRTFQNYFCKEKVKKLKIKRKFRKKSDAK